MGARFVSWPHVRAVTEISAPSYAAHPAPATQVATRSANRRLNGSRHRRGGSNNGMVENTNRLDFTSRFIEDTKTRKSTLFRAFVLSWLSLAFVAQPFPPPLAGISRELRRDTPERQGREGGRAAAADGVTTKDVKFY